MTTAEQTAEQTTLTTTVVWRVFGLHDGTKIRFLRRSQVPGAGQQMAIGWHFADDYRVGDYLSPPTKQPHSVTGVMTTDEMATTTYFKASMPYYESMNEIVLCRITSLHEEIAEHESYRREEQREEQYD